MADETPPTGGSANQITVHDGKGNKDRVTMCPHSAKQPLQEHRRRVREIHGCDVADGFGRVTMPYALARKYPRAAAEWRWQFVFPQEHRWINRHTGEQGRHHVDDSIIQQRS